MNFDTTYHAILGRPALAKFMAVPHYVYLIMKMPTEQGILTVWAHLQISYDCEKESLAIAEALDLSVTMEEGLAMFRRSSPTRRGRKRW